MKDKSSKIAFIVNLAAMNGKVKKIWDKELSSLVKKYFSDRSDIFLPASRLETEKFAYDVTSQDYGVVVSVGGDGTHNAIVNGYILAQGREKGVLFGIIPLGTGSDLSRTILGFKKRSYAEILDIIKIGANQAIDIGLLTCQSSGHQNKMLLKKYFINVSSVGLGGAVVNSVNNSSKKFGGRITFFIQSIKHTLLWKNKLIKYKVDQNQWKKVNLYQLIIANAKYQGGGMLVAPDALIDDGLFDVIVFDDIKRRDLPTLLKIYKGKHLKSAKIRHYRAKNIDIEPLAGEEILIEVDGEIAGMLPASWSVLSGGVNMIVP